MKFHLVTLGCPKNLIDSEIMYGGLIDHGYEPTKDADAAEIIIVNTCAFIQRSKEESINTVLELAQKKQEAACKLMVVTGCLPQRYKDQLPKQMPEVDVWVGTDEFPHIARIVERALSGDRVLAFSEERITYEHITSRPLSTPRHWAYMKVAEGCDHTCKFCIIPFIRGGFRSRSVESLVTEARSSALLGVKELVLVAQDITDYGRDRYGRRSLDVLLRELAKVDGLEWIRIMYAYPTSLTDAVIDAIGEVPQICKYVDMPLQHASRSVLQAMERPGHADSYLRLIEKIRSRIPGVGLRSSFIVGYPGETESQFEELLQFLRDARMDRVGVFTYSQEEGTPGALLENQVSAREKRQRYKAVMETQQGISLSNNLRHVGQTLRVLIDEEIPQAASVRRRSDPEAGVSSVGVKFPKRTRFVGRTQYDAPEIDGVVFITEGGCKPGEFADVHIAGAQAYDLVGTLVPAQVSSPGATVVG